METENKKNRAWKENQINSSIIPKKTELIKIEN